MNKKILVALVLISAFAIPSIASAKIWFRPNYYVTYTGDVSGEGAMMVTGNFKRIVSNGGVRTYVLTFSNVFEYDMGTHLTYASIFREKKNTLVDVYAIYSPESGVHCLLEGKGILEGSTKRGWFRIEATGEFTMSESGAQFMSTK